MATETFFDVRFQGPVKILREAPELIKGIELEMPFEFDFYGIGGTDSLKGLQDDQIAALNGTSSHVYYYCDAEDVKTQFRKLCEVQPRLAKLEIYLTVDVTRVGIEHREYGRV